MKKKKNRKQRKQDRKKVKKQSQRFSELDKLARAMASVMTKMTPPYHDKQGDTFIHNGDFGCFPHGGKWYELSYCKDCYWGDKNCMKRGQSKWRLTDVKGKKEKDCKLRLRVG